MRRYEAIYQEVKDLMESGKPIPSDKLTILDVKTYTPDEIRDIRMVAKMTQKTFARVIGVSVKSVEGWERGYSQPEGAARRLIGLIQSNPTFAIDAGIIRQ